ncbi:MAG TPA: GDP-mannose 4,6-dehydratase [Candidatus Caenarcaniphilales bacterium]|nr:GDP-mannose 4,6-dehydratase [Candidatus Caenarcaniphilales bacterium]
MRVFVTGATGFVGRWLSRDLTAAGHLVLTPVTSDGRRVDVRDADALRGTLAALPPEAIVHLAAIASATEAAHNATDALAVTVGGTVNLLEVVLTLPDQPHVIVVASSEVYGNPRAEELPLREAAALRPETPYALSKVAQEAVAMAYARRLRSSLVVVRPFNHTGPGQRPSFVVPAVARRVLDLQTGRATDIPVGNLDVRRDFSDVRDVARAYRLLVEALASGRIERGGVVLNVASGAAVSIRRIVELLAAAAGVEPVMRVDPELVRASDPAEVRGDASALRALTGWRPEIPLSQTLSDVWDEAAGSVAAQPLA